jgi:DNA helicase-2/ATP-dependent DNA helicase PcrA
MSNDSTNSRISPVALAEKLRAAGFSIHNPIDEQIAIITADLGPAVVIAGAGSGKTETMSQRVLYLVANGIVRPDEILGLTFTRKAAGELAARMRLRLRQLRAAGGLPNDTLTGLPLDINVNVATYNSYAARVLGEHGLRLGLDNDTPTLGEAAAYQIAAQIVENYAPENGAIFNRRASGIISRVMRLSADIAEHGTSVEVVEEFTTRVLTQYRSLTGKPYVAVASAIEVLEERLAILPLVREFDNYRIQNSALMFSDQLAQAAVLVEKYPEIGASERHKYKVVILDEYQDTSYSQVRLLSTLFGAGHPVTAVGDPNQAIYGWRSASAQTLDAFPKDFASNSPVPCQKFTLLTTWRNDAKILSLANRAIDEIAIQAKKNDSVIAVDRLNLRNGAPDGYLEVAQFATAIDEAEAIADFMEPLWNEHQGVKTCAVLVRNRRQIPDIEEALRRRGLPVDVVGLGGLIHLPEIEDIIALLRTLVMPDAGSALMRLIAGPRMNLGVKDIAALGDLTRYLFEKDRGEGVNSLKSSSARSKAIVNILESATISTLEADEFVIGSAIEAVEYLNDTTDSPRTLISRHGFTEIGLARLTAFAKELKSLRRALSGSVTDAIVEAERYLSLDTEVLVRDGWQRGRRNVDKFLDEANKFQRNGGSLISFLDWLKLADSEESGLKQTETTVSHEAIQILTIHASKGCEWDFVAVPGLAKDIFPGKMRESDLWTKNAGSLPIPLRGDVGYLKVADFHAPEFLNQVPDASLTFKEVRDAHGDLEDYWSNRRIEEEYRLAYVAFTRARSRLLCTTAWFNNAIDANPPSPIFLWCSEVAQATDAVLNLSDEPTGSNPKRETPATKSWPVERPRAIVIADAAEKVRTAEALNLSSAPATNETFAALVDDARAIIAEVVHSKEPAIVYLPSRLSVSTLMKLNEDADALALNIRRPIPQLSNAYARRGTTFHEWIEEHFKRPRLFDEDAFDGGFSIDGIGIGEFDEEWLLENSSLIEGELASASQFADSVDDPALVTLKEKWLASEWADRAPIGVEVGFETILDGTVLNGRIDAVYQSTDESGKEIYEVVDWKTGKSKQGKDLENAAIQLAAYRLAYARMNNLPLDRVSATFYYIGDNATIRPADLLDEAALINLVKQIPTL